MKTFYAFDDKAQWMRSVCDTAKAANTLQWDVAYMLMDGRSQFRLSPDEWADAKREIADQLGYNPKTIENWLSVARRWPINRREVLHVEDAPFSVLAETVGLDDADADALATTAAEQTWTVGQMRAEIAGRRNHVPNAGNVNGYSNAGHAPSLRQPTVQCVGNAEQDAEQLSEAFGDEYMQDMMEIILNLGVPF